MHYHSTHEMALKVFKIISEASNLKKSLVKKKFVDNDYGVTMAFWKVFNACFPKSEYNRIDFCPDCNKFELYFEPEYGLHLVK